MKTLKEIKDEVAEERFFMEWDILDREEENELWPEVCRRAQLECGKATLEKASESMKPKFGEKNIYLLHKIIITNKENIVIIK